MGVIETDQWLKAEFDRPLKICEKLVPYFKKQSEREIYDELCQFGMYRPNRTTKQNLDYMNTHKLWSRTERLLRHYRTKWDGPDIPVFLFPLAQTGGLFVRQETNKSGVSFRDKMFLFISPLDDLKELEAIFVHEYHHVCRLNKQRKQMNEICLLDSLIIEGLAEYSVLQYCGSEYLANWCRMYSEKELETFWNRYIKDHLNKRKNDRLHDALLFGGGRFPKLLGYAAGFKIVESYYTNNHYSAKLSFCNPAEKYLPDKNNFPVKSL